jgi:hypothetical protein
MGHHALGDKQPGTIIPGNHFSIAAIHRFDSSNRPESEGEPPSPAAARSPIEPLRFDSKIRLDWQSTPIHRATAIFQRTFRAKDREIALRCPRSLFPIFRERNPHPSVGPRVSRPAATNPPNNHCTPTTRSTPKGNSKPETQNSKLCFVSFFSHWPVRLALTSDSLSSRSP